ncbi:MAG: hypothetical protein N4A54_00545 [Peptostreptococcaceae bacterium]|nr:hypothetical protein [Peptostreptococcaceae bacterium]
MPNLKFFDGKKYVEPKIKLYDDKKKVWLEICNKYKRVSMIHKELFFTDSDEVINSDECIGKIFQINDELIILRGSSVYKYKLNSNNIYERILEKKVSGLLRNSNSPNNVKLYFLKNHLYVSNVESNTIGEIDIDTLETKFSIYTFSQAHMECYEDCLYVSGQRKVNIYNSNMKSINSINISPNKFNLKVDKTGVYLATNHRKYSIQKYDFEGNRLWEIDKEEIDFSFYNAFCHLDEKYLYIQSGKSGAMNIYKIDKKTGSVIYKKRLDKINDYEVIDGNLYIIDNELLYFRHVNLESGEITEYDFDYNNIKDPFCVSKVSINKYEDKLMLVVLLKNPKNSNIQKLSMFYINPNVYIKK